MKYSLVIFDLDGTLLDTLGDLAASVNYALAENNLPQHTLREVRSFVGNGIRKLIERSCGENQSEEKINAVHNTFREHYAVHCADTTCPYDGVTELLRELKRQGIKTAVVSNKTDDAVKALAVQYFPGLFDCAIGAREGVPVKPAPDSVNEVLRLLDETKEHAVYVGDSDVDVMTARNSGMEMAIVTWGFRERDFLIERGAVNLCADAEALRAFLLQ